MSDLATKERPIVVIDRTKDGHWLLIAGKASDDTFERYYYAPSADIIDLGVEIPASDSLPARAFMDAGGVGPGSLRQMHACAKHKGDGHPWSNRLSNPAAYRGEWVGLSFWFD